MNTVSAETKMILKLESGNVEIELFDNRFNQLCVAYHINTIDFSVERRFAGLFPI